MQTPQPAATANALVPHRMALDKRKPFDLNLPEGFDISVVGQGLGRVRFFAKSPDDRIFVTDMFNRTDNSRGAVYILDGFDAKNGGPVKMLRYLERLRNPNSLTFHTDRDGTQWLYLALTDRLVRYRYTKGERAPSSAAQPLATFPDYGLDYKYGGWHLTRTVAIGPDERVYVAAGSSCNSCEEKEEIRAAVVSMDLDGANQKMHATGLRNAVGMRWVNGRLIVTNMGADHLGDTRPTDTMHIVEAGVNFGWPFCYPMAVQARPDPRFAAAGAKIDCAAVPRPFAAFRAHSSPLGFEYFDASSDPALRDSFLVALHGASKLELGHGYRLVQVREGAAASDFMTGFLRKQQVHGRPADVMRTGPGSFLVSDDHAGAIYHVFKADSLRSP